MIPDYPTDLLPERGACPEPPQHGIRNIRADLRVPVEVPLAALVPGEALRLADIVEQHCERQRKLPRGYPRCRLGGSQQVLVDVQAVESGVLLKVEPGAEFRHDLRQDIPEPRQHPADIPPGLPPGEQPGKLCEHSLCGDIAQQSAAVQHCGGGTLLHPESQGSREAHSAQYPQRVLVEAPFRLADTADNPPADILRAAEFVEKSALRAVGYAVHREISPGDVLAQAPGECDGIRTAAVVVFTVHPVGGYLHRLPLRQHRYRAVLQPGFYQLHAGEHALGFLRQRGGGYVVVVGLYPHKAVAHATADDVRLEPGAFQHVEYSCDV